MFEPNDFLQPRSGTSPSGEDLEYDGDFIALGLAARPTEERQVGDSIIAAEDPDFAEVVEKALAVLGRSHDLRAAAMLANAELRLRGIPGFVEVLAYMRGCVEQYWDSCHPMLDVEDDDDPTMRVNAILGLTDPDGVLKSLRLAPLTNSKVMGRFSYRDIMIATGEIPYPADAEAPDMGTIAAAFEDTDPEWLARVAAAARMALGHVKAITAVFDERTGAAGPDLGPLERHLFQITKHLDERAPVENAGGEAVQADGDETGAIEATAGPLPAAARQGPPGAINSREDVMQALGRICEYYARHEPSSPVPLLLKRARRLVTADFMEIMRDMAPHGVEQIMMIGGITDEEE